jgi:hypothetical protein
MTPNVRLLTAAPLSGRGGKTDLADVMVHASLRREGGETPRGLLVESTQRRIGE